MSKKGLLSATSKTLTCSIRANQLEGVGWVGLKAITTTDVSCISWRLIQWQHGAAISQLTRCGNVSLRNFASSSAPPLSYDPAHPPILFDLVLRSDWKTALKRVSSHPIEAKYRHPRGYTLLHCAVEYGAPVELIDKMAKAHPEALEMNDWQGRSIVDVATDSDTKVFLQKLAQVDLQQKLQDDVVGEVKTDEVGSKLSLTQMNAISKQLLEIETSCHRLRIQLDALTDELKGK